MEQFLDIIFKLLQGLGQTTSLFVLTLLFSLPLGLIFSFGSMSKFKPISFLVKTVVWIIRGTPLLLQILVVSFVPRYVFGLFNSRLAAMLGLTIGELMFAFVSIAFIINYACYFSEIFRAGIQSVPVGQSEAGQVLGLKKSQIFFKIILMQVVKRTLPPLSNEIITLVKDTSLATILGVIDLFGAAQQAVNQYVTLEPLAYAAVFYLIFNGVLTLLFNYLEKKMSYYKI